MSFGNLVFLKGIAPPQWLEFGFPCKYTNEKDVRHFQKLLTGDGAVCSSTSQDSCDHYISSWHIGTTTRMLSDALTRNMVELFYHTLCLTDNDACTHIICTSHDPGQVVQMMLVLCVQHSCKLPKPMPRKRGCMLAMSPMKSWHRPTENHPLAWRCPNSQTPPARTSYVQSKD